MRKNNFLEGLKLGLPIGLGYFSVSITFGILCIEKNLFWWQGLLISLLTLTSAGQVASLSIIVNPSRYVELLISQCTINMRYSFMGIAFSQKLDSRFNKFYKWILGFFITDEIFAVAITKEKVSKSFFLGLVILPYIGWGLGTLIGCLIGNLLPEIIMSSLSIAIYGMFIAIIVPPMKEDKTILLAVIIAIISSCLFNFVPLINKVPFGISISICAIVAAIICAILFPVKGECDE